MNSLLGLLIWAIDVYIWIVIAGVIISWAVAFDVLNIKNKFVYKLCTLINAVTNPVILKVRKIVPPIANMDFSPVIVIFGLMVVQSILKGLMY
jgi:YggT family protein